MLRRSVFLASLILGGAAPSAGAAVTVSDASATEGGDTVFTVTRDGGELATASTADVTAREGSDYAAPAPAVVFAGNTATVTVETTADTAPELDETFNLVVTPSTGDPARGVGTIVDDDPPVLAVQDARASEAAGGLDVVVTVTPVSRAVTFGWATSTGLSGRTTVAPGADRAVIAVPVVNDDVDEDDETFTVTISPVDPATIGHEQATATVTNDDLRVLRLGDAQVVESDGAESVIARVPVSLSGPTFRIVTVRFATIDGTARAPADYLLRLGTLTIRPGQGQAYIDLTVRNDDVVERPESFGVLLGSPSGATLGRGAGVVTILDDDALGDDVPPNLRVGAPRLVGRVVQIRVACPRNESRCRGRATVFTRPERRSPVRTLRTERRVGRSAFSLRGGQARNLRLRLPRTLAAAGRRAGRLRVNAYVLTEDANENFDTAVVPGTLRFRR